MKRVLLAVIIAAVGNSIVYAIAYVSGMIPWNMLSPGRGVSITPRLVILVSIGGAVGGGLLYSIIKRFAADPVQTFRLVAFVALMMSFWAPYTIPTFTKPLMLALDAMHVVVYVATVWALTVWARPRQVSATA